MEFALKLQPAALRRRPGRDHLGPSCVFDGDSHRLREIAMVWSVVLVSLSVAIRALATRPLASRATLKMLEHPHRNRRAAMAPEQIRLGLFPEA